MSRPTPRLAPLALLLATLAAVGCGGGGGGGGPNGLAIASTAPTAVSASEAYAYQVAVAKAKGPVVYTLTGAPPGMTLSPDGLIEWTPAVADLGSYDLTLEVRDDKTSATQDWTLRVDQGLLLGTTLSPRLHTLGSTEQDFIDHFTMNDPYGQVIAFHSPWREDVVSAGQPTETTLLSMLASQMYGFTPALGLGWADGEGTPDLTSESDPDDDSWTNQETRAEFLSLVSNVAAAFQPPYLFLGNETNSYYLTHTQDEWDAWISEFEACYDAIKAVSPDTLVFTVFQYERMAGVGGALTGWTNEAHFELLADHIASGKIDGFGFTTYPYLEWSDPADIPDDDYDALSAWWTGPVIFTEVGWRAKAVFPFSGSDQDQADFVDRFFDLTQDLDLAYVTWAFLHDWDQEETVPAFVSIGLRNNDATVVRPADARWRANVALREEPAGS